MAIKEDTYLKALARVREAQRTIRESSGDDEIDVDALSSLFQRIKQDATGVLPDLKIFQSDGPLHEDLVTLTKAYTFYRSDHGYIPGTQAVAATLLINLRPFDSFVALGNMLNRALPLAFLSNDAMAVCFAIDNADFSETQVLYDFR